MIALILTALVATYSINDSCPPINFAELQPPEGEEFVYAFWGNRQIQPGSYKVEITGVSPDGVSAETSFLLITEAWTEPSPQRSVAGIILFNENEFDGTSPRQVNFRPLDPPVEERSLSEGEELRLPMITTGEVTSGEPERHEGDYIISHAGCGELLHEGETIRTRRLRAEYSRFVGQPEVGWTLTDMVQIYHIPVGANWFYAQHREENHPMQQGTIMEGYTAP